MVLMGLVSFYTMDLMLHSKKIIQESHLLLNPLFTSLLSDVPPPTPTRSSSRVSSTSTDRPQASFDFAYRGLFIYSSLGEGAFGQIGKIVSEFAVFSLLVGIAAGYMLFIGSNFASFLSDLGYDAPLALKLIIVPGLPCLLSLLRTYDVLARVASLGILCVVAALGVIFFFGPYYSWEFRPAFSSLDAFNFAELPSIIGVSAFLLAIHAAVISFAEETTNTKEIRSALRWGCVVVVLANVVLAFIGYVLWGNEVKGYIFCNVDKQGLITTMKGLLVVELLCSLPLALRPNTEIVEKALRLEEGGSMKIEMKRNLVRFCVVLLSYALTIGVPVFQDLLELVGGVCGSAVAFVIPACVHIKLLRMHKDDLLGYETEARKSVAISLDSLIAIVGMGIMGWTLYGSIQTLIRGDSESEDDC
ncbi:hypothetical protein TrRE_jg353 [Triparma retinervis]|uniref:Amino acid transporter transmembrane domain-containing protein n=1 Tax=Triparma retinervis TaxID=2557542 RepID=A0A9W7DRJ2_9STRA|nr:hypothetical protein TrRE_jg353 [Triparma retinervis]